MLTAYDGQARIGRLVREATAAAVHDPSIFDDAIDIERVNDILVGEAFVNTLAEADCMIVRMPKG